MSLEDVAKRMVASGKGILAADESTRTILKRFQSIGKEGNLKNRSHYRGSIFMSEGIEKYISGVILYDESVRLPAHEAYCGGKTVIEHLTCLDIIPGIKVDKGTKILGEHYQITEGLDGLRERLAEYRNMGLQFAKWRAVIQHLSAINTPELYSIRANAHSLARYAKVCQEEGIVPIVEPELLLDSTAYVDAVKKCTELTLRIVFDELYEQKVNFKGMILKPNMVMNGYHLGSKASTVEVARSTLDALETAVPVAVPGIAFLSGGQSESEATTNLQEIASLATVRAVPWRITFSFGRALQETALKEWAKHANFDSLCKEAQQAFLYRAEMNSLALTRQG